jgi:hypothetical protein
LYLNFSSFFFLIHFKGPLQIVDLASQSENNTLIPMNDSTAGTPLNNLMNPNSIFPSTTATTPSSSKNSIQTELASNNQNNYSNFNNYYPQQQQQQQQHQSGHLILLQPLDQQQQQQYSQQNIYSSNYDSKKSIIKI